MREGLGIRVIVAILLVISIFSPPMSGALTTFGKSNQNNPPQNPPQPPTPVGKARECKMDNDCAGIQNTTCMSDRKDGKLRCLCGDYTAPLNGACANKYKAIHALCTNNDECILNAHCVQSNSTNKGKRCYCKEGYFEETPMFCSGCSSVFTLYTTTLLLAASIVLGKLNYI
ncbi:uncharacterized protein LOC109859655 [Pseudomyrmex gracilis]|uniref:uncharacterized protein LOC109859655 n=1 Tax=Pseudomyrmex gracilis TaxID=219809 RepID=UPI0009959826|nr:uncharacterized protein LOC109859655 [Pseudomyrmex gracilis]XP_020293707.1 uncharacterized protein LOC109859655 [Pseudomyrmex gracilis]XP_020293708.1 uncharacterized protein LOC109859655 [Pseudomyrmex gracilis]XP_020293709.1 uncharacterized protein LOC109859655 [Pseudomyrmex gracilis]